MSDKEHPAEPAVNDEGSARGGFAKAAEHLNALFPVRRRPISRQLVHKWWLYRHVNRFPEAVDTKGNGNGGRGRPVFNLTEVADWYVDYTKTRGGIGGQGVPGQAVARTVTGEDSLAA